MRMLLSRRVSQRAPPSFLESFRAARICASIPGLSRGISGMILATNLESDRYLAAWPRHTFGRLRLHSSPISSHSAVASPPAKWFAHKSHSIPVTSPSSATRWRAFPQHAVHRVSTIVDPARPSVISPSSRLSHPSLRSGPAPGQRRRYPAIERQDQAGISLNVERFRCPQRRRPRGTSRNHEPWHVPSYALRVLIRVVALLFWIRNTYGGSIR